MIIDDYILTGPTATSRCNISVSRRPPRTYSCCLAIQLYRSSQEPVFTVVDVQAGSEPPPGVCPVPVPVVPAT